MGGVESSEDSNDPDQQKGLGYRVFNLCKGSPAHEAGLQIYFDYIVGVEGRPVDGDQQRFFGSIRQRKNTETNLTVFSTKTTKLRHVKLTPKEWGGKGLLGATIRFDAYDSHEYRDIRVTNVFENSPAEMAGVTPNEDFLLGAEGTLFRDLDDLVELVQRFKGKCVSMYVYNVLSDDTRVVPIVPSDAWGGRGILGCEFGTGLLHRIPDPQKLARKRALSNGSINESESEGGMSPVRRINPNHIVIAEVIGQTFLRQSEQEQRTSSSEESDAKQEPAAPEKPAEQHPQAPAPVHVPQPPSMPKPASQTPGPFLPTPPPAKAAPAAKPSATADSSTSSATGATPSTSSTSAPPAKELKQHPPDGPGGLDLGSTPAPTAGTTAAPENPHQRPAASFEYQLPGSPSSRSASYPTAQTRTTRDRLLSAKEPGPGPPGPASSTTTASEEDEDGQVQPVQPEDSSGDPQQANDGKFAAAAAEVREFKANAFSAVTDPKKADPASTSASSTAKRPPETPSSGSSAAPPANGAVTLPAVSTTNNSSANDKDKMQWSVQNGANYKLKHEPELDVGGQIFGSLLRCFSREPRWVQQQGMSPERSTSLPTDFQNVNNALQPIEGISPVNSKDTVRSNNSAPDSKEFASYNSSSSKEGVVQVRADSVVANIDSKDSALHSKTSALGQQQPSKEPRPPKAPKYQFHATEDTKPTGDYAAGGIGIVGRPAPTSS
ncbi:unnamed protein product [Amoebophrya sp. A120]|nr:unnamed protein product [Amoebophrya sp. A120]|eukprot:GSA120T00003380001.1